MIALICEMELAVMLNLYRPKPSKPTEASGAHAILPHRPNHFPLACAPLIGIFTVCRIAGWNGLARCAICSLVRLTSNSYCVKNERAIQLASSTASNSLRLDHH